MAKKQIGTVPSVQKRQRSMRIAVSALDRTTRALNKEDNRANRNARTRALARVREARRLLVAEEAARKRAVTHANRLISRRKKTK